MRALRLEYRVQPPGWAGWALLALAVLLGADAAFTWFAGQTELAELRAAVERPPAHTTLRRRAAAQDDPTIAADLRFASRVLDDLALPWNELFQSLEGAQDERVALLSVRPDAHKGILQMTGEAKDYAAILTFITRLEESRVMSGVHLVNHEIREEDPQRPFFFTIAGTWGEQP